MVSKYAIDLVAKEICGEIVWSDSPGQSLRKWREIFKVTQTEISQVIGVAPSVISDYEKGRRIPGSRFVRKYVEGLLYIDSTRGWSVVREIARNLRIPMTSVIDIRELSRGVPLRVFVEVLKGEVLWGSDYLDKILYGYTVLDSIESILSMSGAEFSAIMGLTTERALIFTKVGTGRSPMVAVRVTSQKPGAVILHGPRVVDPLAIKLAELDRVPLIVSRVESEDLLVENLRKL
ncbi:MAG: helix-turn-helix domain-containing protein [Fervidicoccaceae archaeon]|jgi:putative transcriptional regulator|nr:helix-turn-helix domain-containing protein [Fervidicoccaceae archaeon]NAZ11893.1 helix-turn-helix domain-containing protein [Desulfurococcales archaeon]